MTLAEENQDRLVQEVCQPKVSSRPRLVKPVAADPAKTAWADGDVWPREIYGTASATLPPVLPPPLDRAPPAHSGPC